MRTQHNTARLNIRWIVATTEVNPNAFQAASLPFTHLRLLLMCQWALVMVMFMHFQKKRNKIKKKKNVFLLYLNLTFFSPVFLLIITVFFISMTTFLTMLLLGHCIVWTCWFKVISWCIPVGWSANRDRRGSNRHSQIITPPFLILLDICYGLCFVTRQFYLSFFFLFHCDDHHFWATVAVFSHLYTGHCQRRTAQIACLRRYNNNGVARGMNIISTRIIIL